MKSAPEATAKELDFSSAKSMQHDKKVTFNQELSKPVPQFEFVDEENTDEEPSVSSTISEEKPDPFANV